MPGRRWTDTDRRRLVELTGNGASAAQAAQVLGRTESAVWQQLAVLRQHGVVVAARARRWTSSEDARLIEALAAGTERSQIAARLGRSPGAVTGRAIALRARGVAAPRRSNGPVWTPGEDRALVGQIAGGATVREAAATLGRSQAATSARVDLLRRRGGGPPPRRPRWDEPRRAALAARRRQGATYRELAAEFGRDVSTIKRQLRTLVRLGYDVEPRGLGGPRADARRRTPTLIRRLFEGEQ